MASGKCGQIRLGVPPGSRQEARLWSNPANTSRPVRDPVWWQRRSARSRPRGGGRRGSSSSTTRSRSASSSWLLAQDAGHQAVSAESGAQALQILSDPAQSIDVLLTDVFLADDPRSGSWAARPLSLGRSCGWSARPVAIRSPRSPTACRAGTASQQALHRSRAPGVAPRRARGAILVEPGLALA